jgi:hypothetical protein
MRRADLIMSLKNDNASFVLFCCCMTVANESSKVMGLQLEQTYGMAALIDVLSLHFTRRILRGNGNFRHNYNQEQGRGDRINYG